MAKKEYSEDYKKITSELDEIKILIQERDQLLKLVLKNRRKLKTKLVEYSFINDLIARNLGDTPLENAVKGYFNELGFKDFHRRDEQLKGKKEEDVRFFIDKRVIIFEIGASDGCNPTEKKLGQITKRMGLRKLQYEKEGLTVSGCVIINHDFKVQFTKRCKNPFNNDMIEYAKASNVSLVTTTDLVFAFIDIKNGKIKPGELIDQICTPGIFKVTGAQHKLDVSTSMGQASRR
jgi:hypothetical protein